MMSLQQQVSWVVLCLLAGLGPARGLDLNGNQQSDVWELHFNATGLTAQADADGDEVSNRDESIAGTDPRQESSVPLLYPAPTATWWPGVEGKYYTLQANPDLATGTWSAVASLTGHALVLSNAWDAAPGAGYRRLLIQDLDSDGDQLSDWEEAQLGLNPQATNSERYELNDRQWAQAGFTNTNTVVTCSLVDGMLYERWPDPGVVALRRTGSIKPLTVNFSLGGSATRDLDYTTAPGTNITFPLGVREVWVEFAPVADASDAEGEETIVLTLHAGPHYKVGTSSNATVTLGNETASSLPNPKSAARFLIQAAFGPDQDSTNDVDLIPENVEEVMAMGFEAWITNQLARPVGLLQPFTEFAPTLPEFYTDPKQAAWWNRAMGVPSLVPGGPAQLPDPLRQRMGFALSQILVVSDRPEALAVEPDGLANYYDMILSHAFGNYRALLYDVTLHPCMGFYLSHLFNRKPDPLNNIFPDENYAREIMQLFSIGLWELNQDGSRRLGTNGLPIPTYDNGDITEFARVFTGLGYGPLTNTVFFAPVHFETPMKPWDAEHDLDPKTLLNGLTLPARTASVPDTGTATLLDINAAMDNLFGHTNCAPFLCRQLIQRFVTSNPSTGYLARVTAVFNNNGANVRGDLGAVLKAILMDSEARDPVHLNDPAFGKQREPFLRVVNFARAFNASAPEGVYRLDQFFTDHYQEPLRSPSVFNFYLPGYLPPGPLALAGLVGPEFQIVNAGSAISAPNYYYKAVRDDLHRWGNADPNRQVRLNLLPEMALLNDVDTLVRRLDLALTGGTLSPREFQIVREAAERVTSGWEWEKERIWLAVYLVVTSPSFCVMR